MTTRRVEKIETGLEHLPKQKLVRGVRCFVGIPEFVRGVSLSMYNSMWILCYLKFLQRLVISHYLSFAHFLLSSFPWVSGMTNNIEWTTSAFASSAAADINIVQAKTSKTYGINANFECSKIHIRSWFLSLSPAWLSHKVISNTVHRLFVTLSYFWPDRFVQLLSLIPILILLVCLNRSRFYCEVSRTVLSKSNCLLS